MWAGVIGLVITLVIGVVNLFLLPAEIGNMYAKAGQPKPVTGLTGFWNLIPLIGTIIWVLKVQGALNKRWLMETVRDNEATSERTSLPPSPSRSPTAGRTTAPSSRSRARRSRA